MSLTFGDIPAGASLFLDANTFVYAHSLHPNSPPNDSDFAISQDKTPRTRADVGFR